jgi:hypothetical protein
VTKTVDSGNISVEHQILIYSKPVTEEMLIKGLNATYSEVSTWVTGKQEEPEVGEVSVAYRYTAPDDPDTKDAPLRGYLFAFGVGNVYESFFTMGDDYESLLEISEVAAGKLQIAGVANTHVWKSFANLGSIHYYNNCDSNCQIRRQAEWNRRAEEENLKRLQCVGYDSCSGAY